MTAIATPGLWTPGRDGIPNIEIPGHATPGEIFGRILDKLRRGGTPELDRARDATILHMAGFSNAAELDVLDTVFGDHGSIQLYTAPTYLSLTTVAVAETDTAGTLTEANYTGFARKSIAAADMSAASAGAKTNGNTLTFANCTAGTSTIIGWAVVTTSSGAGTVIVFGTCTSTVISTTQTPPTVNAGALSVTLD
jgi:hypothetical protein